LSSRFESLFPTIIMQGALPFSAAWNKKLLAEIEQFASDDTLGRSWSKENYHRGYTSYASLSDMNWRSPTFSDLHDALQKEAEAFAKAQGWNLKGCRLVMSSCWMNIMPKYAHHTNHLHPHSVISGTYYVSSPPGSVALKLEDPRMMFYMAAPVREKIKNAKHDLYYKVEPKPGSFVLFESWLRHEVPPNRSEKPRVSVSFNYSIENEEEDTE
jgi:uncharacterized protein (TIGR02466 family)